MSVASNVFEWEYHRSGGKNQLLRSEFNVPPPAEALPRSVGANVTTRRHSCDCGAIPRNRVLPDERWLSAVRGYASASRVVATQELALFLKRRRENAIEQCLALFLSDVAKSAGIPIPVTPHMIRHTVATLLLRFGTDIRVVQEVLGHASIATTQRYTHVSKDDLLSSPRTRHPSHHLSISLKAAS